MSRLWDSYIFEGDKFIFKVGLAILVQLEAQFKPDNFSELVSNLNDVSRFLPTYKVLSRAADKIYLTSAKISSLRARLSS